MGSYRIKCWCLRLTSLALWLLLAMTAAHEVYDEVPDDSANYPDDNLLDTGPIASDHGSNLALSKDPLLYKLFQGLYHRDDSRSRIKYKPDWMWNNRQLPHYLQHPSLTGKERLVKRITETLRGSGTKIGVKSLPQNVYRPQQKWKIKKGSQMVCYFKLCAFRSPL